MAVGGVRAWWADDPISTVAEEALGRGAFVDRLVAMLGEIGTHPSSTVLALVGPWGSGKTSTINLVLDKLDEERWGIARLNPWALGSAQAIVAELLGSIRSALPEKAKSAREKLKAYAVYATPAIGLIPGAGSAATKAFELAAQRWLGEGTLQSHLEDLATELAGLERPVLVFVDDVDRLQPEELLALLRAIRVVGRLPNVHYAVAYDQLTLVDLVKSTSIAGGREDRALAFLEKIVTLRADQPVIRPGQSAALFNAGLAGLLTDLGADLGEEARRRLSDEWELLLSADLVEPRTINRYLAQLRVHLPIVGADEVDLVDFLVVTHLRATYPPVYRAVLADRSWLAAPVAFADDERLRAWRDGARLVDLVESKYLSAEQNDRLLAAVRRLFPALEPAVRATSRHRGISNPDYIDRYFVFARDDFDLSDTDLVRALHTWARGGGAPPLVALDGLLTPDPGDREACASSASALRRLEALTEHLSPAEAAAILDAVVQYLPLPSGAGVVGGPDAAMIQWLVRLLRTVEDLDVTNLMHALARRGFHAVVDFLRALSAARAAITADWLSELTARCAGLGWTIFADHVREGDVAPDLPTATLFSLVENLLGAEAVNLRLQRAVAGGLPVVVVAARLIEVGVEGGTRRQVIVEFDAEAMIRRLGLDRVRAALAGPQLTGEPDERDVSWAGRRRHAAAALRVAVASGATEGRLPTLPASVARPFVNRATVLRAPGAELPDLRIAVNVLMPADASPDSSSPGSGLIGDERERAVLATLEDSPMTRWMGSTAKSWPLAAKEWEIADPGDGRRYTHSVTALTSTAEEASFWRVRTPILAGASVQTGGDLPRPFLVADFEIGLWLTELSPQRLPAGRRHDSRPLPAALSLNEMDGLLTAMIATGIETASALFGRVVTSFDLDPPTLLGVQIEAPSGIEAVVNLENLQRAGAGGSRTGSLEHVFASAPGPDGAGQRAGEWALALLGELLLRSGYRNYEQRLLAVRGWRPG